MPTQISSLNKVAIGPEIATSTPAELASLSKSITPTGAAMEATKVAGAIAPSVMSTIVQTGVGVLGLVGAGILMYAGAKSVITGRSPFSKKESLL